MKGRLLLPRCDACHTFTTIDVCRHCGAWLCGVCAGIHARFAHPSSALVLEGLH